MTEIRETLGSYLRTERERRNISLEQISYATRISVKMLRALEEDRHEQLPAPAFVRGYLQAYAKYAEVDPQDIILRYQHHLATMPGMKKTSLRSHYLYVKERYQEKRRLVLVISLFALLLVGAGGYLIFKHRHKHHTGITKIVAIAPAPKPKEKVKEEKAAATSSTAKTQKTPKVEATKTVAATATAPATPSNKVVMDTTPKKYNLKLTASEDVWMRFQTDSSGVTDMMLHKGQTFFIRANKVIKLFSGNLGALNAYMNGKELKSLVTPKRNMSVVLPESEIPNYPLPLFPQQQKQDEQKKAAESNSNNATHD